MYTTEDGITVSSTVVGIEHPLNAIDDIVNKIDNNLGILLTSSYEFPGRYARWSVGFTAPAIQIEGTGLNFKIKALNARGVILIGMIEQKLLQENQLFSMKSRNAKLDGTIVIDGSVIASEEYFPEEERSKQPSLFSLVRSIRDLFLR